MNRPMRSDEMHEKGYFDLDDPFGAIPKKCSYCGLRGNVANPLSFYPATRDMKQMAHQYLYRSICRLCKENPSRQTPSARANRGKLGWRR